MLAQRFPAAGELVRYGTASGIALGVDFGALIVCTETADVPYPVSAAVGFSLGMVVAYLLSVAWVFPARRRYDDRRAEAAGFVAIGLAGLAVNQLVIWHFTEVIGLYYQVSKVVSAAVVFLFSFHLRRTLLFSRFNSQADSL